MFFNILSCKDEFQAGSSFLSNLKLSFEELDKKKQKNEVQYILYSKWMEEL